MNFCADCLYRGRESLSQPDMCYHPKAVSISYITRYVRPQPCIAVRVHEDTCPLFEKTLPRWKRIFKWRLVRKKIQNHFKIEAA